MTFLRLTNNDRKLYAEPELPLSKSISTRVLVLQSLYPKLLSYDELSGADDVKILKTHLERINICTASGIPYIIYSKNSGAVMRFLTAYASMVAGQFLITGDRRLLQRPVGQLVESLQQMNADISYTDRDKFCPLKISGRPLRGGKIDVDARYSSQFLTALLLISNEVIPEPEFILKGKPASESYTALTIDILGKAGIKVSGKKGRIKVHKSEVKACRFEIEKDWASASFWYMMLLFAAEGEVVFNNLSQQSLLPEAVLPRLFEPLGIATLFTGKQVRLGKVKSSDKLFLYNFLHNPDLALPVITAAAITGKKAVFTGLENLRYKESDRLRALMEILNHTSIEYESDGSGSLTLKGNKAVLKDNTVFDGRNDHRVIMTIAALALYFDKEIKIKNFHGVEKSYPHFWEDVKTAGFLIRETAR